ncbi:MAG: transglycosylase SLT domain-containing protein [Pseudomonadota bacterium]
MPHATILRGHGSPLRPLVLILIVLATGTSAPAGLSLVPQPASYSDRQRFISALVALRDGQLDRFKRIERELDDYLLQPYLRYQRLRNTMSSASATEIRAFFREHPELPVTPLLRSRWLRYLGQYRLWSDLLKDYEPRSSADLRCFHLRARLATGDRSALDEVARLWTVGKSQPKACDPLFKAWIDADRLTESMVWQRLGLALKNNERSLARYLTSLFDRSGGTQRPWADLYYRAHTRPETIARTGLLQRDSSQGRDVVEHALKRLARRDDRSAAESLWTRFDDFAFSDDTRTVIAEQLLKRRARDGSFPRSLPGDLAVGTLEDLARQAVLSQNWSRVVEYIEVLPLERRSNDRWQYWLGRALEQNYGQNERVLKTYDALAGKRSYYGFLAAELRGLPPQLNERHTRVPPELVRQVADRPEAQRALELLAVRERISARREWRAMLNNLTPQEQAAAAVLAQQIGWLREGVAAANAAGLRDDLELRFPLGHLVEYRRMNQATSVPLTLLMAITRQESAFDPRARSSANARGLMQLLPTTASWVAKRVGLPKPTNTALYRPSTNIEIASHYLAFLLARYDGSRPLAIAAYNAGERRVDRWIREASELPMDVWIESIPFNETRNYVQNVLAFSQVYSSRLDVDQPTLYPGELLVTGPGGRRGVAQIGQ